MIIDASGLDATAAYKLLIGSLLPRAVAWVSTLPAATFGRPDPQGHLRQHPGHRRVRDFGDAHEHVVWGEVVRFHLRDDLYLERGRIDTAALPVIGRLAAEY